MNESIEALKALIEECTENERGQLAMYLNRYLPHHPLEDEWGVESHTILSAIRRSSDLTKRGVRGIIAEAFFENDILPMAIASGWTPQVLPSGDWPYDALLQREGTQARIQIKLQRLEAGDSQALSSKVLR